MHGVQGCVAAIRDDVLIEREGRRDKEFHFQNWFGDRLGSTGEAYDEPGRNTYPDFRMVRHTEGYELKGLAYPGRDASYDCNSQIPCGEHNGRQVFYVFGRYPKKPDGNSYPVLDIVICHGSFLNADNDLRAQEQELSQLRQLRRHLWSGTARCMSPQRPSLWQTGTAHHRTLILPADMVVGQSVVANLRL